MTKDDGDNPFSLADSDAEEQLDVDPDRVGTPASRPPREEPRFAGFEEDDYEEPERDTDYATVYAEEEDLEEEAEAEGAGLNQTASVWSFEDADANAEEAGDGEEDHAADSRDGPPEGTSSPLPPIQSGWKDVPLEPLSGSQFDWQDGDYDGEDDPTLQQWPLGMIIVGAVALLLLAAGGYGVIQQRSAAEEEIRQLQAALATSATPEEVAASQAAAKAVEQRNVKLQASLDALVLENKHLTDTVAGLEAQLQAQQEILSKRAASEPAPLPAKKTSQSKPAPEQQPGTAASAGTETGWFVNFGSYIQRDTAEDWSTRLSPGAGKVVVSRGARDGQTFYRVRVVGLGSREQAESIARKLEKEYDLTKLWVGQQ